ncbi:hypothetical protein AAFF_G00424010 [Aldrovandia affinis]|uniref:Uncharacterized protein n=1 Tax=Aldrovandia affinis TaxID=143900 RepID=A0AAD7WZG0_9TELE|nr:hypothetical protein AAFF_G00424010 [Aldrovandia affinis]
MAAKSPAWSAAARPGTAPRAHLLRSQTTNTGDTSLRTVTARPTPWRVHSQRWVAGVSLRNEEREGGGDAAPRQIKLKRRRVNRVVKSSEAVPACERETGQNTFPSD